MLIRSWENEWGRFIKSIFKFLHRQIKEVRRRYVRKIFFYLTDRVRQKNCRCWILSAPPVIPQHRNINMARWRVAVTDEWIMSRIKQGHGAGEGLDYKPWLTVRDFPSLGRVHRVWGCKTGRIHHLFSDLELKVFLHFLWPKSIQDQREQFPLLPLEETIEIAKEMGVRHPTDPRTKHPIVMTTDMVLTVDHGLENTYHPYTVKYMKGSRKATND